MPQRYNLSEDSLAENNASGITHKFFKELTGLLFISILILGFGAIVASADDVGKPVPSLSYEVDQNGDISVVFGPLNPPKAVEEELVGSKTLLDVQTLMKQLVPESEAATLDKAVDIDWVIVVKSDDGDFRTMRCHCHSGGRCHCH